MTGSDAPRASFAVRVSRPGGRWRVELLAEDAGDELPVLERALGDPGAGGWPGMEGRRRGRAPVSGGIESSRPQV